MIAIRRCLEDAERVMVVAPHPDDEALATGGVLNWTASANVGVRVLFLTSGENNPWAQRATERRWDISAADRRRWGRRRRVESLESLECLGLPPGTARFLGFSDQRITEALIQDPDRAARPLFDAIVDWKPDLLFAPSLEDRHPDHSAAAVLTQLAVSQMDARLRPRHVFEYLVHRGVPRWSKRVGYARECSASEHAAKQRAILRHTSQFAFRRGFMLNFAAGPEYFETGPPALPIDGGRHPLRLLRASPGEWSLAIRPSLRVALGCAALILLAQDEGEGSALRIELEGRNGRRPVFTVGGNHEIGEVHSRWRGTDLHLTITTPRLRGTEHRLAKLDLGRERAFGLFDPWPWLSFGRHSPVPVPVAVSRRARVPLVVAPATPPSDAAALVASSLSATAGTESSA